MKSSSKKAANLVEVMERALASFEFARGRAFTPLLRDDREGLAWLVEGELEEPKEGEAASLVDALVLTLTLDDG